MRMRARAGGAVALLALVVGAGGAAQADEDTARELFKAMTDHVGAQTAISFDYDAILEIVSIDGQKVAIATSGAVALERPDRFRATRRGGFVDAEIGFDGSTVTLVSRLSNSFAEIAAPGSFEEMVATLKDGYGAPLPAVDLLTADSYDAMMEGVTEARDLGSGVIGGEECDHLAFRAEEVDWQVWITQGDAPRPCKLMITAREVAGGPQYSVTVHDWRAGAEARLVFDLDGLEGATRVALPDLADITELSGIYAGEGAR